MKSIFDKKLSSKLSEKVSSKTIKEMLKDFYKMLRLECLVDFEELKSEILQKEQELLKDKILGISDDVWILISYNKFKDRNDRFEELKKKWCKE